MSAQLSTAITPLQQAPERIEVTESNVVPIASLLTAMRICLLIMAAGAAGAIIVALTVLGPTLLALGALVAFTMTLFIGLPLMLASIEDAIANEH